VDGASGAGADRARDQGLADPVGSWPLSAGLGLYRPAADAPGQRAAGRGVRAWLENTCPAIARRAKAQGCEIQGADETGLSNQANGGRSFAPRGQTPIIRRPARRFSQSMISSLTNQGKLRFMIYEGALNTAIVLNFRRRLVRAAACKLFVIPRQFAGPSGAPGHRLGTGPCRSNRTLLSPALCPRAQSGRIPQ
jgi:DDE superfamily endonuclease